MPFTVILNEKNLDEDAIATLLEGEFSNDSAKKLKKHIENIKICRLNANVANYLIGKNVTGRTWAIQTHDSWKNWFEKNCTK